MAAAADPLDGLKWTSEEDHALVMGRSIGRTFKSIARDLGLTLPVVRKRYEELMRKTVDDLRESIKKANPPASSAAAAAERSPSPPRTNAGSAPVAASSGTKRKADKEETESGGKKTRTEVAASLSSSLPSVSAEHTAAARKAADAAFRDMHDPPRKSTAWVETYDSTLRDLGVPAWLADAEAALRFDREGCGDLSTSFLREHHMLEWVLSWVDEDSDPVYIDYMLHHEPRFEDVVREARSKDTSPYEEAYDVVLRHCTRKARGAATTAASSPKAKEDAPKEIVKLAEVIVHDVEDGDTPVVYLIDMDDLPTDSLDEFKKQIHRPAQRKRYKFTVSEKRKKGDIVEWVAAKARYTYGGNHSKQDHALEEGERIVYSTLATKY